MIGDIESRKALPTNFQNIVPNVSVVSSGLENSESLPAKPNIVLTFNSSIYFLLIYSKFIKVHPFLHTFIFSFHQLEKFYILVSISSLNLIIIIILYLIVYNIQSGMQRPNCLSITPENRVRNRKGNRKKIKGSFKRLSW